MALLAAALLVAGVSASAAARPVARSVVLNVLPPGQSGSFEIGRHAVDQLRLYDRLTPMLGAVRPADLARTFKAEGFGLGGQKPTRIERPRRGVRILRDGWDARAFRAYYLFGGLLTAPLLGVGSLLRAGVRRAAAVGLVYAGLAIGVAIAVPVSGSFSGSGIPPAQDHLDLFPARLLAILGNGLGTLAAVGVAVLTIRRRPLGNALIVGGLAVAAAGSALVGLGEAGTAAVFAAAALLLYLGFSAPAGWRVSPSSSSKSDR